MVIIGLILGVLNIISNIDIGLDCDLMIKVFSYLFCLLNLMFD